ncbi:MAG TPA: MmcQ/YjbR family DNA-binding protein [Candidatus Binataceae bacterium]|nr:MmcQ/YjbR family DNA-binding protein [Candidatus Binataceae bacterium]
MAHPKQYDDSDPLIIRLRKICLALPKATEKEAWGECTFRIGGKMFAMTDCNHHESGHIAVWIKATPIVQEILINSKPAQYFKPPYVGHKGWVGARLNVKKVDWGMVGELVKDAYLMTAPKELAAMGDIAGPAGKLSKAPAKKKAPSVCRAKSRR